MDTRARLRDFAARVHDTACRGPDEWRESRWGLRDEAAAIVDDLVEMEQHEIAEKRLARTACDHPSHLNPGLITPCPECGQ